MLVPIVLVTLAAGDPSLSAYVDARYSKSELAKLEPAALLERAYADNVLASNDAKASGARLLLELRDAAAGAGARVLHTGNPLATPLFTQLAAAPSAAGGVTYEREPNDTRAWPDPAGCGALEGVIAYAYDAECAKLSVAVPTLLHAVTSAGTGPEVGDTTLELTDSRGGLLAFDDDAGPGGYSQLAVPLLPGEYGLCVRGFQSAQGSWRLTTTCTPIAIDAFVPGTATTGSVDAAQPLRAYTLELASDTRISLRCAGSAGFDPVLYVRSASGAALLVNDDAVGVDARIDAHLPAGQYQLWVHGVGGALGSYELSTVAASALALPVGCANSTGAFASAHEWNFYRCVLGGAVIPRLSFESKPVLGGTNDTAFALYDASLRRIDTIDGTTSTSFAGFVFMQLAPGTYYVAVSAGEGPTTSFGAYSIASSCTSTGVTVLDCDSYVLTTLMVPNFPGFHVFQSTTPQPFELRAVKSAFGATTLDSALALLDAEGRLLDWNDDADAFFGSAVGTPAANDKLYLVLLGSADTSTGTAEIVPGCALRLVGVPRIGAQFTHVSRAKSGDRVAGFGALAAATPALSFPPLQGVCWLDPASAKLLGYYQMGAAGQMSVALRVPPQPQLVGIAYEFQNVVLDASHESGWFTNSRIVGITD